MLEVSSKDLAEEEWGKAVGGRGAGPLPSEDFLVGLTAMLNGSNDSKSFPEPEVLEIDEPDSASVEGFVSLPLANKSSNSLFVSLSL